MSQISRLAAIAAAATLALSAHAAAPHADVVVLMDESGSMSGEQAWMRSVIPALDTGLIAEGLTDNRFGLVGFGASSATSPAPSYLRSFSIGGAQMGSSANWVTASNDLKVSGSVEDGWAAIDMAADYSLRATAARNFILVTDEDRDNTNSTLNYSLVLQQLKDAKILLNAVVNNTFRCGDGSAALGIIGSTGYKADGAGGFTTCTGAVAVGAGAIKTQYVDLALASGGGAWNLNILRSGGNNALSFSNAFLAGKIGEITTQPPAVPEPSTYGLLAAGMVTVGWALRRRKQQA